MSPSEKTIEKEKRKGFGETGEDNGLRRFQSQHILKTRFPAFYIRWRQSAPELE